MSDGRSLLIAEDDAHAREAMTSFFTEMGFTVHAAANGEAAIKLAEGAQPDLLISDWLLGGEIDGVELFRRIRSRHANTALILLTSFSRRDISRSARDIDIAAVFEKPASLHALLAAVTETLSRGK